MSHLTRRSGVAALAACAGLGLAACSGGGFDSGSSSSASAPASASGPVTVRMLIGASGDTELAAVEAATSAWAKQSGNTVEVTPAAKLTEELAKGFAGGSPADLFYVDPTMLGTYAKAGNLYAYGDRMTGIQYIDTLRKTFTYDGKFYCAPKDFSTLALVINEDLWQKAGLTDADVPKDWAGLESVSKKLTSGGVTGLVMSGEHARVGAFFRQAGGWFVSEDGRTATANSPEMVAGLTEVQKLLRSGSVKFAKQVDAGWGGEALIKGKAAMTIEGNWIRGALRDAPNLRIKVVELPAGPKGQGTLTFTNCWGIGAASKNQAAAMDLVKFLGQDEQQLAAAKAFGVMPSTQGAMAKYTSEDTADAAFSAGAKYGQGPVNVAGFDTVLADFDSRLEGLATGDPKAILDQLQKDEEAVLTG